jgi:serine/threonine protein kinase
MNKDLTGKTIYGRFRLGDRVGGDRACVIHRAENLSEKRPVAVAVLSPGVRVDPDISSAAAHPNLVTIQEVIEKNGEPKFVAMDLPAGKSLEAVVTKRGKLDTGVAVSTAMQLLSALHSIHDRDRIHANLHPGNIFLDKDDEGVLLVSVADIGLTDDGGSDAPPFYSSPEQVIGEGDLDRRSDIWTVGALLYEMLLGRPPFPGGDMDEITGKILLKEPEYPDPSEKLPEDLLAFVRKALDKEPDGRYENVTEAIGDLLFLNEEFEDTMTSAVSAALRESIMPPPPPPAALKKPAKPDKEARGLPSALSLFGSKQEAEAASPVQEPPSQPAGSPPPLPGKQPPPLPEKVPADAARTMPLMKEDPTTESAAKEPEASVEVETETPEDREDSTTEIDEEELEEQRETEPVEDRPQPDDFRSGDLEARTTLPAPSGIFHELDEKARVEEESRRMPIAGRPDQPAPKKRGSKLTLIVAAVAGVMVICFVAVLIYAFSGGDEPAGDPEAEAAEAEVPPKPEAEVAEAEVPPKPEAEVAEAEVPPKPEAKADEPEPEPEPEPAGDSDEIALTFDDLPEGALIKINGVRAKQPIRIPKSKKTVTLGIYLTGYHSHWERFKPTEDREIQVSMAKKAKGGGQKGATGGQKGGKGDKGSWANNPWKK